MTIQSGRLLRRLITRGRFLEEAVHFGAQQVFGPGTSNYTCILIMSKEGRESIRFEQLGSVSLESWRYGQAGTVTLIPATELNEEPWQFADAETQILFARVRSNAASQLIAEAEILVGVQTSADQVYMIHGSAETPAAVICHWNNRDWPIERGVLRPCLHDVQLNAYGLPRPNAWIIFPYEISAYSTERAKARLITPEEFAARYPACWAFLNARKTELESRDISGGPKNERQWYQYGRSQSITKFNQPKIILPVLSLEPRYSYDDANTIISGGGNGPYYMIRARQGRPVSNYFLLAILNHPFSEGLIRMHTSTFRGGYYSHGKQFIKNLPIPLPTSDQCEQIDNLVDLLIRTLEMAERAGTPHERNVHMRAAADLRQQIELTVSVLFGLSATDTELVRAVPIPA
jgi:hypothetical protein